MSTERSCRIKPDEICLLFPVRPVPQGSGAGKAESWQPYRLLMEKHRPKPAPFSVPHPSHLFPYEVETCWARVCHLQIAPSCWWLRLGQLGAAQGSQEGRLLQRWGPAFQRSRPVLSGRGPESLRPPHGSPQRSSRTGPRMMTVLGDAPRRPLQEIPDTTITSHEETTPGLCCWQKTNYGQGVTTRFTITVGSGEETATPICLSAKECFPKNV